MDEPPLLEPRDNLSRSGGGTVRGRLRQTGPLIVLIGGEYHQEDYNDFNANEASSFQISSSKDSGRKSAHSRQNDALRQAFVFAQWVWPLCGFLVWQNDYDGAVMYGSFLMFMANMLLIATTDRLLDITDILPFVVWGACAIFRNRSSFPEEIICLVSVVLVVCACLVAVRLKKIYWSVDNLVSITLRKFNFDFKRLQEQHEEERLIKEQENAQKLRIQQEKLAYLESSPIARQSMVQLFIVAAAAVWSMGSLFYFSGWLSSIQVEQIEWKPR